METGNSKMETRTWKLKPGEWILELGVRDPKIKTGKPKPEYKTWRLERGKWKVEA
jgi:hypothetical protein